MHFLKRNFLITAIIFSLIVTAPVTVYAAEDSPSMRIHGIYLGQFTEKGTDDENNGGDAVLLESDGEYILMDTGRNHTTSKNNLKKYLDKNNVENLSLYISHLHQDHYGAYETVFDNYNVETLYLPDKSIATEFSKAPAVYNTLETAAEEEGADIIYLDKGDNFKVGDASFKILAPVDKKIKRSDFLSDSMGSATNHYVNNYSLVAMVSCGTKKYFTGGDIEKAMENKMISAYGKSLKADVMKLNHHGISTSNQKTFLSNIRATYSFFMYSGDQTLRKSENNGKWYRRGYASRANSNEYGISYVVNDEAKDLVIDVRNSGIKMYKSTISDKNRLIKWVTLQGADGYFKKTDKFYIDPNTGKPVTKQFKNDGKLYYMGNGGCMYRGVYSSSGTYNGWRKANGSASKMIYVNKKGQLHTGFNVVSKYRRYFDKNTGYRLNGKSTWSIKTIGKYKYCINHNGVIYREGWWRDKGSKYRYFSKSSGAMKTGWTKINKKLYYFNKKRWI